MKQINRDGSPLIFGMIQRLQEQSPLNVGVH